QIVQIALALVKVGGAQDSALLEGQLSPQVPVRQAFVAADDNGVDEDERAGDRHEFRLRDTSDGVETVVPQNIRVGVSRLQESEPDRVRGGQELVTAERLALLQ